MATGYHDDSNNPRYNFVPHTAGSEGARGIPALGKLVYRTDDAAYEYCTDTSPDPTLNGGGTWEPIVGSSSILWTGGAYTPTVVQDNTSIASYTDQDGYYRRVVGVGDGFVHGQFNVTVSAAGATGVIFVRLPPYGTAVPSGTGGQTISGHGIAIIGGTTTLFVMESIGRGSAPTGQYFQLLGLPTTALASGDRVYGQFHLLYDADANGN